MKTVPLSGTLNSPNWCGLPKTGLLNGTLNSPNWCGLPKTGLFNGTLNSPNWCGLPKTGLFNCTLKCASPLKTTLHNSTLKTPSRWELWEVWDEKTVSLNGTLNSPTDGCPGYSAGRRGRRQITVHLNGTLISPKTKLFIPFMTFMVKKCFLLNRTLK